MLLTINDAVLHFVGFGRGTLRFGELLVHYVRFVRIAAAGDYALILSDRNLVRRDLNAASMGLLDRLRFLASAGP